MDEFKKLVESFAHHTQAQTQEIWSGDAKTGNKHATKVLAAFDQLRSYGDAGRDALAELLTHPSMDVRTSAATFLLRYRTAEAKAVLQEAAKGKGLIPFEAFEALKRWEEGTWSLDLAEDAVRQSEASRSALPIKRSRSRMERAAPVRRRLSKRAKVGK
ncbi:DUF2019 domain-containing protein [Melittangium boletus]|uniref:DUF2019 domain-containing protein n=1 Tax=Melittangium boletus TaxID=83453 RepID=UPI000BB31229